MACLRFEHGIAGWTVQTNPLSYDRPHTSVDYLIKLFKSGINTFNQF